MLSPRGVSVQLPQEEQYPMSIERGNDSPLNDHDWPHELKEGFSLNQTTSQCCRCCCLQPNIDWKVYPYQVSCFLLEVLTGVVPSLKYDVMWWSTHTL